MPSRVPSVQRAPSQGGSGSPEGGVLLCGTRQLARARAADRRPGAPLSLPPPECAHTHVHTNDTRTHHVRAFTHVRTCTTGPPTRHVPIRRVCTHTHVPTVHAGHAHTHGCKDLSSPRTCEAVAVGAAHPPSPPRGLLTRRPAAPPPRVAPQAPGLGRGHQWD